MFLLWHPSLTAINLSYTFPILETSATALCGTTGKYICIYIESIYIDYQMLPWMPPSFVQIVKWPKNMNLQSLHRKTSAYTCKYANANITYTLGWDMLRWNQETCQHRVRTRFIMTTRRQRLAGCFHQWRPVQVKLVDGCIHHSPSSEIIGRFGAVSLPNHLLQASALFQVKVNTYLFDKFWNNHSYTQKQ